ncbi:hypothetical protein DdX_13383 [Ditylenchus destructor]|uniref:Uncharacterized protein n=1 Tax=Ditylenchus destructor TaxID=166010 RepID=A0AAD4MTM5_9BILA|nr:hypothetical protein DdX_13383 [Ditylenchus destructor]
MVEPYTARRVIGEGALETLPTTTTHFHDEAFQWSQGTHSNIVHIYVSLHSSFCGLPVRRRLQLQQHSTTASTPMLAGNCWRSLLMVIFKPSKWRPSTAKEIDWGVRDNRNGTRFSLCGLWDREISFSDR